MPFSECSTTCTSSGMKFGTRVGIPMPRLTYWPSSSSRATRAASWSRVRVMSLVSLDGGLVAGGGRRGGAVGARAGGAVFDPLALGADDDHPVDEDPGQVHVLGPDVARFDEFLDLGDGDPPGHAGQRVEVAGRLVEPQVAVPVTGGGPDQAEVGGQRRLQHVLVAVEDPHLLRLAGGHDVALVVVPERDA